VGWFDGAASADGTQSGARGIIRISDSTVYKWTFNTGPGTNNRAELLGVWVTLFLASRLHLTELQIIGDSKIIIDWCNGRGRLQILALDGWKEKIRELSTHFGVITFIHAYKEFNMEADDLSKKALKDQHQHRVLFTTHSGKRTTKGLRGALEFSSLCLSSFSMCQGFAH
jgi:ribonuclease HI